jgi:hypothetical protein
MRKHRKQVALSVLVVAVSVLLTLLVFELGLRFIGFRSAVLDAKMFDVMDDDLLPYVLHPGYEGYFDGGKVTVAGDGNRAVPLPSKTLQDNYEELVLLGDSVVFGQGLDDGYTIGAYMQKKLSSKSIRVAMIGAPGYTSWNEFAALLRYRNLPKVKTVVLVYVGNDITMDNDYFKFRQTGGRTTRGRQMDRNIWQEFLHAANHNSRVVFAVTQGVNRLIHLTNSRVVFAVADRLMELIYRIGPEPYEGDEPALAYSMEAIKKMHEECAVRGIDLVVAIHRDGFYYRSRKVAEEYERKLSVALEAIGVDHFVLRSAAKKLDYHQFVLAFNDGHPSAVANEIIADEIVAHLSQRGAQERMSVTGGKRRPELH